MIGEPLPRTGVCCVKITVERSDTTTVTRELVLREDSSCDIDQIFYDNGTEDLVITLRNVTGF